MTFWGFMDRHELIGPTMLLGLAFLGAMSLETLIVNVRVAVSAFALSGIKNKPEDE